MKTFLKFVLIISVFNYSNECNSQNSEQESVTVTLDLKTPIGKHIGLKKI